MAAGTGELLLMAVGDVGPYHEPLDGYPVLAKPTLAQADVRFAHCEKVFSTRGTMQVHSDGHYSRQDLETVRATAEMLHIHVLGLAVIAPDVSPELARQTIATIEVLGALQASPEVKAALKDRIR